MRRLTRHLEMVRVVHQRNGERGAVAIITAVSLVVLLLAAALALDVGLMYEERAQLQSSADAAALAVAQDCAVGRPCTPVATLPVARKYAAANVRDTTVDVDEPVRTGNSVEVAVHSLDSDSAGSLALNFGFVTGQDEADVSATATASWQAPYRGTAALPFMFSRCNFHLGKGPQVLQMHSGGNGNGKAKKSDGTDMEECSYKASSGHNLPGGFGMIDSSACEAIVVVGQKSYSDPGNSLPNECKAKLSELKGETVLLPVYSDLGETGNNGWYVPDGWAAFKLLGWRFPSTSEDTTTPGASCPSSCTGVVGEFVRFVGLDETEFELPGGGDPTPTDYGAVVVGLDE
jgi:Flp pilus assembly protein TadG